MFGAGAVKAIKEDLVLHIFGLGISDQDDEWENYRGLEVGQFMKLCPFYLFPAPNLYLEEYKEMLAKLILPDFLKDDYQGPLVLNGGIWLR